MQIGKFCWPAAPQNQCKYTRSGCAWGAFRQWNGQYKKNNNNLVAWGHEACNFKMPLPPERGAGTNLEQVWNFSFMWFLTFFAVFQSFPQSLDGLTGSGRFRVVETAWKTCFGVLLNLQSVQGTPSNDFRTILEKLVFSFFLDFSYFFQYFLGVWSQIWARSGSPERFSSGTGPDFAEKHVFAGFGAPNGSQSI